MWNILDPTDVSFGSSVHTVVSIGARSWPGNLVLFAWRLLTRVGNMAGWYW